MAPTQHRERDAGDLSPWEQFSTSWVRRTHETESWNRFFTVLQERVGALWIDRCTVHLRHVYGLERIEPYRDTAIILVANHRSFFDMFVVNAVLYREAGFKQRFLFPVRANFFYDRPLGLFVNAVMSFFSMYPPIYRDRSRAPLNHASFEELARLLAHGHRSAGIHPEGTRNRGDDPYTFLPPQSGVGRLIHLCRVPVLPVFINGLQNNLWSQVRSNFRRDGEPVICVYGDPVEFDGLLDGPPRGRTYKALAARCMEAIEELAREECRYRSELLGSTAG